jgi:hypothetical protein
MSWVYPGLCSEILSQKNEQTNIFLKNEKLLILSFVAITVSASFIREKRVRTSMDSVEILCVCAAGGVNMTEPVDF